MPQTVDALLEKRSLTCDDLARMAGITPQRAEAIAAGRWTPSPVEREKIAAGLGLPLEAISWGHSMSPRNVRYHRYGLPEHLSGQ